MHAFDIDGLGKHAVEWTLERENSDLGALGRLMISGRIMLDGKRKIAIWNILDWRNPDLVMEKSLPCSLAGSRVGCSFGTGGNFWGIIFGAFLFHHKTSKSSGR